MSHPTRIGPYRILGPLGSGGMGRVYLAERADGAFQARVAIKLLRSNLVSTDLARRFRRERQILADLSHPAIARLLDGGETEDGVPYLVMEHVEGTPIDLFCQRASLSLRELLQLFLGVCAAVRHAHARLVVHTDLKPANILVDAGGHPTLLDFGIAKLTAGPDTELGEASPTVLRPLTPAYSSPEQIEGAAIATSTDVYSLGVVLYELLTGALPYPESARGGRELEEAILHRDPQPPSARPRTATTGLTARDGRIDRDLDTIVLKALAKDPSRRYASVERFADDIERYLRGDPVLARPDTFRYRAAKFVRRHRGGVVGGALATATVAAFGIVSVVLAARVEVERNAAVSARDEADAVSGFLVDIFDARGASGSDGLTLTARDILGFGGERVRRDLADRPQIQGAVARAIGDAYVLLGAYDSAISSLGFAAERTSQARGARSLPHALTLAALGRAQAQKAFYDDADASLREALSITLEAAGPDAAEAVDVWNSIALLNQDRNRLEDAEAAYNEALRIQERVAGGDSITALLLTNVASVYVSASREEEAVATATRALEIRERLHGDRPHMETSATLNILAMATENMGRYAEAEPLYLRTLAMREAILPPDHPYISNIKNNLGSLYINWDQGERSVPLYEDVVATYRRTGQQPSALALALSNYAVALNEVRRYEDAIPAFEESVTMFTALLGPESASLRYPLAGLARAQEELGRYEDAERTYKASFDVRQKSMPAGHPDIAFGESALGTFYLNRGRLEEAAPLLEHARTERLAALVEGDPDRVDSNLKVGRLRAAQGRIEEARELITRALEEGLAARGPADGQVIAARAELERL